MSVVRRNMVAVGAGLALMTAGLGNGAARAGTEPPTPAPTAEIEVAPQPVSARDALATLGDGLSVAAQRNGMSLATLRAKLAADPQLWLDRRGHLFVKDAMLELDATEQAQVAAASPAAAAPFPYAQTFLLHSRPGANRIVYLDFNGETISGTAWNDTSTGDPFTASPYDSDGSPATFSTAEQDVIQAVWQMVAEDYAPFGIDVTTEAPTPEALNRTGSADLAFGTRALISNTSTIYDGCGCGGVAYVGTFDTSSSAYYQPAWVFTQGVGTGAKGIAEATSHEVGHNLGLDHDATSTSSYYGGHGNWAPIMGVGYNRPIVQFSSGEYSGANNTENDYSVIVANGGPAAADDIGDTTAAAALVGASPATLTGVIGSRTDTDVFKVTTAATTLTIGVTPSPSSPNLDAKLELLNAAGAVIASNDPATGTTTATAASGMAAALTQAVAAGTYYVRIDGVGYGNPLNTGYSDFGSLGRYTLSISGQTPGGGGNQPPTATINAAPSSGTAPLTVSFTSTGSTDPDGTIASYSWNFGDGSATQAGPSASHSYAAGTYTATLTVTDNQGASASASRQISVTSPPTTPSMHVQSITMSFTTSGTKTYAVATIKVVDANGRPVSSAKVFGTFSGPGAKSTYGSTGSTGIKSLTSGSSTLTRGTWTFTVTNITKSSVTYLPASNVVTSASITK